MKRSNLPLVIAHRGASAYAPENTLAAAQLAYQMGAGMWELDVCLTKDNALLVLHDDTLARTTDVTTLFPDRDPWQACDFTLAEVKALDFGSWYNQCDPRGEIASGSVTPEMQRSYAGESALTLEKALNFTRERHWQVNVEIKDLTGQPGDNLIVPLVTGMIRQLRMGEQVLISSFNHDYLRQVKALTPKLRTAALVSEPQPDPIHLLESLGASAYHPHQWMVEPGDIQALRSAGYDVNVWTVNDPEDARRLADAGATGIITDFPNVIKANLDKMS